MAPVGFSLRPVKLPAVVVLGCWFLLQLVSSLLVGGEVGGVAFRAHLGGFVAGMLLVPLMQPGRFRRR